MSCIGMSKGADTSLFVGDCALSGVSEFKAQEKTTLYEIRQIFDVETVESIEQKKEYELTLTTMSGFDNSPIDGAFELRVVQGNEQTVYGRCRVVSIVTAQRASDKILTEYHIIANSKTVIQGESDG